MIRLRDHAAAEQIRKDRVGAVPAAGPRLGRDRGDRHAPPDRHALAPEQAPQQARAGIRKLEMQGVEASHQGEVGVGRRVATDVIGLAGLRVCLPELHPVSWTHDKAACACSSYLIGLTYPSVACRRTGL